MSVNYAETSTKVCSLFEDFARQFVERQYGKLAAEKIYANLPKYQRGKNKGKVKGWVRWTKCTKGGWVRKGPYDHDGQRACGYVMGKGTHNVEILLVNPFYCPDKAGTYGLEAGNRREVEKDEQWAARCEMGIRNMQGLDITKPSPVEETCHPLAHLPGRILEDAARHMLTARVSELNAMVDPKHPITQAFDIIMDAKIQFPPTQEPII